MPNWKNQSNTLLKMFLGHARPKTISDPDKSPLRISPDTRVSEHAEGLTLLHIPSGQIFVCNRTAARIWRGAADGKSLDDLSGEMSRHFHIELETAKRDATAIVRQMEGYGLVVRSAA